MSIKYMSAVWERADLTQSQTLVALAIADHADDEGHCYPSIDRIALKARIKRRQTQAVIRQLEDLGLLRVERHAGRRHANDFWIKRAIFAPLEMVQSGAEKVRSGALKGAVATAPQPPVTVSKNHQRRDADYVKVEGLDAQAWLAWMDYRRSRRLARYKTDGIARKLAALSAPDQRRCVQESIDQGWQGLFPERLRITGSRSKATDTYHDELRRGVNANH